MKLLFQHIRKFLYIIAGIISSPKSAVIPPNRRTSPEKGNPPDRRPGYFRPPRPLYRHKALPANHHESGLFQVLRIEELPLKSNHALIIFLLGFPLLLRGHQDAGDTEVMEGKAEIGFLAEISICSLRVVKMKLTYSSEKALR